jgi:hypothetical protein
MSVPAGFHSKPIVRDTVTDLNHDVVVEVLSRHGVNVSGAAAELGVESGDLRRLLWANPKLLDTAVEMEERRLDLAERNIFEALRSDDSRRRDATSFFVIRNTAKAKRRGWIVSASAGVGFTLNNNIPARTVTFRWRGPDDPELDCWGEPKLIEHEDKLA